MTKWKALLLGPVLYVVGLALLLVGLVHVMGLVHALSTYFPELSGAAEYLDNSGIFRFLAVSLPAVAVGLLAAPPEGQGRWLAAFGSGMLSIALLQVPMALTVCWMLPSILDRSAGSDAMLVLSVMAFVAAAQAMAGVGGLLRYRFSRVPRI